MGALSEWSMKVLSALWPNARDWLPGAGPMARLSNAIKAQPHVGQACIKRIPNTNG